MRKLIFLLLIPVSLFSQVDPAHPTMAQWNVAGVQGYDQENYAIHSSINPGDDIQTALTAATGLGGRKVILLNGAYTVSATINVPDDVFIEGQSEAGVVITSTIRNAVVSTDKTATFEFSGTQGSGMKNLTLLYDDNGYGPAPKKTSLDNPSSYTSSIYSNNPGGNTNFLVTTIEVEEDSQHNLFDNLTIIDSGDNPMVIKGDNNTVTNCFIDGAYNKGSGGKGYFQLNGDSNLIKDNHITNLRHFGIQTTTQVEPNGPRYNVVIDNYLEIDMNFHNEDDGDNLVENNIINTPGSHGWPPLGTGGFGQHDPPGSGNYIVNNQMRDYRRDITVFSTPNVIYTHNGNSDASGFGEDSFIDSGLNMSVYGTFYVPTIDTFNNDDLLGLILFNN